MKTLRVIAFGLCAATTSWTVAAQVPAGDKPAAQFVTLGTGGGPYIRVKRSAPANAVIVGGAAYLFDTGDGVQRQLAAIGQSATTVRAVFLSHHHIDHNAGLAPLLLTRWLLSGGRGKPLIVTGPPGTTTLVNGIAQGFAAAEWAPITIGGPAQPPIAAVIAGKDMNGEMVAPELVYQDENVRVTAVMNDHYHFPPGSDHARLARSYAYRIEAGGRVFVFTGDTGPSERVTALAANADVLVSEVINLEGQEALLKKGPIPTEMIPGLMAHLSEDHLTPEAVGRMAGRANVKKVVLTHLVPGMDDEQDPQVYVRGIEKGFKGPVVVANDLDRF